MLIQLHFKTKNKKSLYKCIYLLFSNYGIINYLKLLSVNKKIKFTILKSPHVNNKSKEHVGYCLFIKKINVKIIKFEKFLLFLKKIELNLFADLNLKIKFCLINVNNTFIFNPDKFLLANKKNKSNYLNILDIFGENSYRNNIKV